MKICASQKMAEAGLLPTQAHKGTLQYPEHPYHIMIIMDTFALKGAYMGSKGLLRTNSTTAQLRTVQATLSVVMFFA